MSSDFRIPAFMRDASESWPNGRRIAPGICPSAYSSGSRTSTTLSASCAWIRRSVSFGRISNDFRFVYSS